MKRATGSYKKMPKRRIGLAILGFAVAVAAIVFARESLDSSRLRITSPQELSAYFDQVGYTAKSLRAGNAEVPRFVMSRVPEDWAAGLSVDHKKSIFFRALLPMVLMANEKILHDRNRLSGFRAVLSSQKSLDSEDLGWLKKVSARYGLPLEDATVSIGAINTLLRRVDVVPPSLALAQSAVESAYASSRFAVEANALFGQWRYGKGLVPEGQRRELGDYRIADFKTPMGSIRAYMRNLNSHAAYRPFRNLRAAARAKNEKLRGATLAGGLLAYSEKGQAYVDLVRSLIARNGLSAADSARLQDHQLKRIITGPL